MKKKYVATVEDFFAIADFLKERKIPADAEAYLKEGYEGIYLIIEEEGKERQVFML